MKKKIFKRKLIVLIIFGLFILLFAGLSWILHFNIEGVNLSFYIFVLFIFYVVFSIWLMTKNKSGKDAVIDVDTKLAKEFGIGRWMYNDKKTNNKKDWEKLIRNYDISIDGQEKYIKKVLTAKSGKSKKSTYKEIEETQKAGWVVASQYIDKTTKEVLKAPEAINFEHGVEGHLDSAGLDKAMFEYNNKIKKAESTHELQYVVAPAVHFSVLGATGSGKGQRVVLANIKRNLDLEYSKIPTMVITDPKGEVHDWTSGYANKKGCNVKVLDFRNPTKSYSWNPIRLAWILRDEANNFEQRNIKIKTISKKSVALDYLRNSKELELPIVCFDHNENKCGECIEEFENTLNQQNYDDDEEINIYFLKNAFFTSEDLYEEYLKAQVQTLKSKSEQELDKFSKIAIPDTGSDPFWTQGPQGAFSGIATALLELMDVNPKAVPLEKFNVMNVIRMMSDERLPEWFKEMNKENPISVSAGFASAMINAPEDTRGSLISSGTNATRAYTFSNLTGLLANDKNQIDLDDILRGEKPTIFYLIIPDDDKSLHGLAAAFIEQFYSIGVKICYENQRLNKTKDPTLTRPIQFCLDEFGNMPKIAALPEYVTVARSRNMSFMFIIQDYKQLVKWYGQDGADVILSNCNGQLYILTTDTDTASRVSKSYGDKPILNYSMNDKGQRIIKKDGNGKKIEDGASATSVPLISADELLKLSENYLTVKVKNGQPSMLYTEYAYRMPQMNNMRSIKSPIIPNNLVSNSDFLDNFHLNMFDKQWSEWLIFKIMSKEEQVQEFQDLTNNKDYLNLVEIGESLAPKENDSSTNKFVMENDSFLNIDSFLKSHAESAPSSEKKEFGNYYSDLKNKCMMDGLSIKDSRDRIEILFIELNNLEINVEDLKSKPQKLLTPEQKDIVRKAHFKTNELTNEIDLIREKLLAMDI